MAKSRTFLESIQSLTWQSLLIIIAVIAFFVWRLMKSPTIIGDWLTKLLNPQAADVLERKVEQFNKKDTGSTYWTAEKIQGDARSIAYYLNTSPSISWYSFKNLTGENEEGAFNVIKNYTNKDLNNLLKAAYRDIATEGRQLRDDIERYLTENQVKYLTQKGII